jgi:hypothetical protein
MLTVTATFDLTILYFVAINVIAILAYVLVVKHRARVIKRNVSIVAASITGYFRENGAEVGVECISRAGGRRFVALIRSKPSKRFRHSNIVEIVLATHVRKACGLELEKVYWCFPIKGKEETVRRDAVASDTPATVSGEDDYVEEGQANLAMVPGYGVDELSLEKYEEFVRKPRAAPKTALEFASGT